METSEGLSPQRKEVTPPDSLYALIDEPFHASPEIVTIGLDGGQNKVKYFGFVGEDGKDMTVVSKPVKFPPDPNGTELKLESSNDFYNGSQLSQREAIYIAPDGVCRKETTIRYGEDFEDVMRETVSPEEKEKLFNKLSECGLAEIVS